MRPIHGFRVSSAKLGDKAKNPVDPAALNAKDLEEVEAFLAAIDVNDDMQNIFVAFGWLNSRTIIHSGTIDQNSCTCWPLCSLARLRFIQ